MMTPYLPDHKLVVLDDDPTGVQTVHDVYVYTGKKGQNISPWKEGAPHSSNVERRTSVSRGKCPRRVESLSGNTEAIKALLLKTGHFQKIVVNAEFYTDLVPFCQALAAAIAQGHHFISPYFT